ncbi:unnamed protein product [Rotaria socialis]
MRYLHTIDYSNACHSNRPWEFYRYGIKFSADSSARSSTRLTLLLVKLNKKNTDFYSWITTSLKRLLDRTLDHKFIIRTSIFANDVRIGHH